MDKKNTVPMGKTKKVLIGLAIIAVSFGAGFFAKPTKVKTEIKEVIKTVTIKEEAKTKIVYKDRIVLPDGTIKETERSEENTNSREGTSTEASRTANSETTRDVGLTLQALAIVDIKDFAGEREYGIYAKKRVFSNISVGALVTPKQLGIGIGMDF